MREREKAEIEKCESEPHCEVFAWRRENGEIHFFELSLLEKIARNRFVEKTSIISSTSTNMPFRLSDVAVVE